MKPKKMYRWVFALFLVFVFLYCYSHTTNEYYQDEETQIGSFLGGRRWHMVRRDHYNDRIWFLEVETQDASRLRFAWETYPHRRELRLISVENVPDGAWKQQLFRDPVRVVPS